MRRKGYALATVLVLMGATIFGVGAVISVSTLESKISRSQQEGTKAYYVAEAGAQDALWRMNNTSTYSAGFSAGTLNSSYSVADKPATGQGYTVGIVSTAAYYATVTVTGYSDNGTFRAQRVISADVFRGALTSPTGTNAIMMGGALNINNSVSTMTVTGGDLYSSGSVSFNHVALNAGANKLLIAGTYSANQSTITSGGIQSASTPPIPAIQTVPGFDFTYYATNATKTYTPAQFQSLVQNGGSVITIAGPITYISADLSMSSWAKNKTINVSGMLVINGNLSVPSSVSGMKMNISDPGSGAAGLFIRQGFSANTGTWTIDGVLYVSGSVNMVNSGNVNVNGGIVTAGAVSLNPGAQFNVTYDATRVAASLGGGTAASSVEVKHWEEEY